MQGFLSPPEDDTELRAPGFLDHLNALSTLLAGAVPGLVNPQTQQRNDLLMSIAPLYRGLGKPVQGNNQAIQRSFSPEEIQGVHRDINAGRQGMIGGKRILSDDVIDNAANYGPSWHESAGLRNELSWAQSALRAKHLLNPPLTDAYTSPQRAQQQAQANLLSQLARELSDRANTRSKAEGLAIQESGAASRGPGASPTMITERSFLDRLLSNYLTEKLGAWAPKQRPGNKYSDLSREQQREITPIQDW